ncbi:alpha/beta hydrolase family protein [Microbulbifer yueqingensis]|uniref:Dipeptidyl aminopeptidase/acylaminoacyl peptidase n=1 Tax=Microbulbifer yueqingensis TaxID=658219 RepID=A0A1G8UX02_9GAMM|nr:prolyl oligopeptidase family serine peptidase [Microbulbifer yueqingensis]SDJ58164.1 Dipeptidyl aminopeptidase/acylaminoacyl peptidase [Microbulbifer yueqingensis]
MLGRRFHLILLVILSLPAWGTPQVPLRDLVKHAEIQQVKISPSGTHIAVQKLHEGERVLVFMSLSPLEITGTLRFQGNEEVGDFYWANDERVVAEVLSRRAALEAPVNYGSLYAINYDGSRGKTIFGWAAGEMQTGSHIRRAERTNAHAILIDPLLHNKKEALVSTYPWDRNWETLGEVLRVNIYTGVRRRVASLPQVGGRAFTDGRGELLFANGTDQDDEYQLFRRDGINWKKVEHPALKRGTPVGFNYSENTAYLIIDRKGDTEQLVRLDMESGEVIPVFSHEFADISEVIREPVAKQPVGVYIDPDQPQAQFFDETGDFAAFFRGLKKAFTGYRISFTSFTDDGRKGILEVTGDRLPGDYFLVDLETKKAEFLLASARWLDPEMLNPMQPHSFTAEDGMRIGLYLTFPRNREQNLPMVVMPHGGPHARDYWSYDQDAQILSQNGYLVLQVNFRGSTGYGDGFFAAGRREWGGAIQEDIAAAARWAIAQGYADRDRICIYGASFGGYSAMMNPIRNPGLYQCAAGYVGVYDLAMLFEKGDIPRRDRGIAFLEKELGQDPEFLRINSPLHNTEQLQLPVFIAHGGQDERAPVEHAEAILEKLQKEGRQVESLILPNEGHGFYSEENNLQLYNRLLTFLDRHIGVGAAEKKAPADN